MWYPRPAPLSDSAVIPVISVIMEAGSNTILKSTRARCYSGTTVGDECALLSWEWLMPLTLSQNSHVSEANRRAER